MAAVHLRADRRAALAAAGAAGQDGPPAGICPVAAGGGAHPGAGVPVRPARVRVRPGGEHRGDPGGGGRPLYHPEGGDLCLQRLRHDRCGDHRRPGGHGLGPAGELAGLPKHHRCAGSGRPGGPGGRGRGRPGQRQHLCAPGAGGHPGPLRRPPLHLVRRHRPDGGVVPVRQSALFPHAAQAGRALCRRAAHPLPPAGVCGGRPGHPMPGRTAAARDLPQPGRPEQRPPGPHPHP